MSHSAIQSPGPGGPGSDSPRARPAKTRLRFTFGETHSAVRLGHGLEIGLSLPLLAGGPQLDLHLGPGQGSQDGGITTWESPSGQIWGAAIVPWDGKPMEPLAYQTYFRLFARTSRRSLYRLWNLVPEINQSTAGLENYRRFCVGRSEAFENFFGNRANASMPAGSAVGIAERVLVVVFHAGPVKPAHFENPLQMPAYHYPQEHSPRPPSFARATRVDHGAGRQVFISGTSAVRGHDSVAPGNLDGQITATIEMLQAIGRSLGLGSDLARDNARFRQFVVYVRHRRDLAAIRARLQRDLLLPEDQVSYVEADICRHELLLEIEGSVRLAQ